MSMKNTALGVATGDPPTESNPMGHDMDDKVAHDVEKSTDPQAPPRDDFRELDFMTRNGLNLRSFTKRKFASSSYDAA